jgi:hypothetical protein
MMDRPMTRDQQIKFMTEAANRRAQRHERWSSDEEFKEILRQPAQYRDHSSSHSYSEKYVSLKTA